FIHLLSFFYPVVYSILLFSGEHPYLTVDDYGRLVYNCDVCSLQFESSYRLLKHIRTAHTFKHPLKCMYCSKRCAGFEKLGNHVLVQHKPNQIHCDLCPKVFPMQRNLEYHVNNVHKGRYAAMQLPQTCQTCGKVYRNKYNLGLHMRKAHAERPTYTCPTCAKVFVCKRGLRNHISMIHGDGKIGFRDKEEKLSRVCQTCGKVFMTKQGLMIHEKNHSTIRPHVCQLCGVSYNIKCQLKRHMRSHEKPFTCEVCGDRFSRKYNLKQHMKVHTGVKEYECKTCGRCFTQMAALCGHTRTCSKSGKGENMIVDANLIMR
ncbi:unnamed protein product, partial [Owenia fusiformis]